MKSRQVGYVLIALIVIGLSGLLYRVVLGGTNEFILEGMLPIDQEIVNQVTISTNDGLSSELIKVNDSYWEVSNNPIFTPKLASFWDHIKDVPGAQLVARKDKHHELLGVDDENSTKVSFYVGPSLQEQLHIGKWSPEVRLCYIRKSGKNDVYSIPCSQNEIFSSDPDSWRNPIVVSIPPADVTSFDFIYPNTKENFSVIRTPDNDWIVINANGDLDGPADLQVMEYLFQSIQVLPAAGFENDAISKTLDFDTPDGALRINTSEESNSPTTRLKLIQKDDEYYYVKTANQSTVFLIQYFLGDFLLMEKSEILVTD